MKVTLRAAGIGEPFELGQLRGLLGESRPLGYLRGEGFSFLAADQRGVKRSLVYLHRRALVAFDYGATELAVEGGPPPVQVRATADFLLHVLPLAGGEVGDASSDLLAGARLEDWLVFFHPGVRTARSVVFFDAQGSGELHYLITGLAPGRWEVWRDGWLENPEAAVRPEAGALYLQGPAASYFLKRG